MLPPLAALSASYSVLYHGGVGELSRWLRPLPVHYRHWHTIWALCSGAPVKWALVKIERAQMDREPCHISVCASRLWIDKMVRICNKASSGQRPDGRWCQLSYVNSDLIFCLSFFPTLLTSRASSLSSFCLCTYLTPLLPLCPLSPSYSILLPSSGRVRGGCASSSKRKEENYDREMIQAAVQEGQ